MFNNEISCTKDTLYTYKTHSFSIRQIGDYIGVQFYLDNHIYNDMVCASDGLFMNELVFFGSPIENERYLIWRFIHNILQEVNDNRIYFRSEQEFKRFCDSNNIEYVQQCWFKRVYFKSSLDEAKAYCIRNSLAFQGLYFSEDRPYKGMTSFTLHDVTQKARENIFKPDFLALYNTLNDNNIDRLYHFTDRSNLHSILESGAILSNQALKVRGIIPTYASNEVSREMDSNAGLGEFVHLSFVRNHPMMYVAHQNGRIRQPVIIEIDPTIALMPNAIFTNMNALKNGHSRGGSNEWLKKIHFDIVKQKDYFSLSPIEKPYYQAEVMVRTKVGTEMFLNYDELTRLA